MAHSWDTRTEKAKMFSSPGSPRPPPPPSPDFSIHGLASCPPLMPMKDRPDHQDAMEEQFSSLHLDFTLNVFICAAPSSSAREPGRADPGGNNTRSHSRSINRDHVLADPPIFVSISDDFCVHDYMNASHTNGVKVHTFIFAAAAAELHSWTRWIQVSLLLHFWCSKPLCELSKLHLLYFPVSLISRT